MSYTFDGANKLIIIDNGVTSFSVSDLYSRWKDWFAQSDNSKYETAFANSVGGNPLGGGIELGSYYFLQNGWVIRPQEANHTLEVTGNLYPIPDTASLFTGTVGSFQVSIIQRNSSLTQRAAPTEIATQVWSTDLSGAQTQDTAGDVVKKGKQSAAAAAALSAQANQRRLFSVMSEQEFWQEFYDLGKSAGAKFPELVAAQAALESGWGQHTSGKNNYFGIKGHPGTVVETQEWSGIKFITIEAEFRDFRDKQECVQHLVDRWYKDWRGYEGVNRASTEQEAAKLLKEEGYATDPDYPKKLIEIMNKYHSKPAKPEEGCFLVRAALYYAGEPHQDAALEALWDKLGNKDREEFKAAYRGSEKPYTQFLGYSSDGVYLDVPYFYQRDAKNGHGERMCFSSSMAMALDYWDPNVIEGDDDWYLEQVLRHGDTISSVAQMQTARSLGFNVEFHMDGSQSDIEELLLKNIPVPIGVLHRGHVNNPSGGGHWVCIIGMTDTHFFVHDPFGEMDLVNGGYVSTGPEDGFAQKYSKENLMKRWTIENDSDGWYVELKE